MKYQAPFSQNKMKNIINLLFANFIISTLEVIEIKKKRKHADLRKNERNKHLGM